MGSPKMVRGVVAACLLLLVLAGVVFAQVGTPRAATAASGTATLRYGCARPSDGLLRYVKRPSTCHTAERKIDLKKAPIGVCVLVERTGGHPKSILGRIHKGAIRVVSSAKQCTSPSYGREVPLVLPDFKKRYFCAVAGPGQIRLRRRQDPCRHGRSIVAPARARPPVPSATATPTATATATATATPAPTPAAPKAVDDTATTDEDTAKDIDVVANDSSGTPPVSVSSVDTDGTKGTVSFNTDGTLRYDPAGKFDALAPGATATDSFTYQVTDRAGRAAGPATVTVTVTGVNDAPVLAGVESSTLTYFTGDPATPVSASITAADADSASLPSATVAITAGYDQGHDVLSGGAFDAPTGVLTLTGPYTPAQLQTALRAVNFASPGGATGNRTITFHTSDGTTSSTEVSRTVSVDRAPEAVDDSKTLDEDAGPTAIDALDNDTNPDGGPLFVTSVSTPGHGSAGIVGAGTDVAYTPAADYCGSDSFTYTLNGGSTATVTLTVTCVDDDPVAVDDSATVDEDSGATMIDVLANDTNDDLGDKLITGKTDGTDGTVTVATDGSDLTYAPDANFCGTDTFRYTITGGSTATVTVAVTCEDDAPVAVNDSKTVNEDSDATPIDVLANDTNDNLGDKLITDTTDADNGTVTVATDGSSLTYQPDPNFCGTDSFSYTITGGSTATVSMTVTCVDDPPDAANDDVTVDEDSDANTIDVLANDTDSDGGPKVITDASPSAHGAVVVATDGADLTYEPNADFCGSDSFNYTVTGGDTATVSVTVTCVDDDPVAVDDSATVDEDSGATPIDVLANDTDVDAGPKTITGKTNGGHGTVAITNSGADLTYTPAADFCGSDTFTYTITGGDTADVSVTVTCANDAPTVDLDSTTNGNGSSVTFNELDPATPVAPNAAVGDVDDVNLESATVKLTNHPDGTAESLAADAMGTSITVTAYDSTTGVLALSGTDTKAHYQQVLRTVTYANTATPATGADRQINFVVNDGDLDSTTATATVDVIPANVAPLLDLDSTTFGFDSAASFTEDGGAATLAPNATVTDVDDTTLDSAVAVITNPQDGAAETLTADAGATGIVVTYFPATHTLTLAGAHTIAEYEQVLHTVAFEDTSNTPSVTARTVDFTVNDGVDSNTATTTVTVTPHNDAPTATDQSLTTDEDTALAVTLSGTDPENDTLTFTYDSASAQGGTITGTSPSVTYTPPADYCGPDSFGFTADDGNGGTDDGTISITVDCANDAPVADLNGEGAGIDVSAAFVEDGGPVTLAPDATVSDTDDTNLESATITLANHPDGAAEGLSASVAGTSITLGGYDATSGELTLTGTDTVAHYQQVLQTLAYDNSSDTPNTSGRTVTVTVNDGTTNSAGATVSLSVTAANDAPTVDLNGTGTAGLDTTADFTEDGGPTTLAPATAVSDPDNANLASATVSISNRPDGTSESLAADTTGTSVTQSYNGTTGVLTLGGPASKADFQQVLRTVTYTDTSQNPSSVDRAVTFKVNDGSADSATATSTVTIHAVNDAPVVDLDGGATLGIDSSASFVEDSPAVAFAPNATVSDVDNTTLSSVTLTLANHPNAAAESLSVTAPGGNPVTAGAYNAATGVLTLTGPATPAQFQAVIRTATYNNTSDTPDPTNRDIQVVANDGTAASMVAHATVTVTSVNDAPVATDETFNGTNSAIGNTTLNVNDTNDHGGTADGRPPTPDPTDTSPVVDRPHKTITGDILANDTDPDSPNSALTVTAGTFATNDGGTVTIQSDGDFNFEPAPGTSCADRSDFFDYTVTDNNASAPGSDIGRVTVAITGCVWYVNNKDAQGNSGTSEKPFDTLAQAQAASSAGDSIFVYDGDDATTGYNAGITLKTGQSLLSEGADLTIGSDTLHTADSANKASLTNTNADVVTLAPGSTLKSFNVDPQGTGGGVTQASGAGSTLDDVSIVDNGTKGTGPGLNLSGLTGTTNVSNLVVNNGDGSAATTTDEGVKLSNAGTVNFAATGTISITTNGAAGLDAAAGGGTTSLGDSSTFDDITVTNSGNGGVSLTGTTGTVALGDGSGTDLSLTTTSGATPAFQLSNAANVTVDTSGTDNVSATGGPAVDTASSAATLHFDTVSSTNSSTNGISLVGLGTGVFDGPGTTASPGTIIGATSSAVRVDGGSGNISYYGLLADGPAGSSAANIQNRTAGNVTLGGNINDSGDAGGGILLSGNTGGTTTFSGLGQTLNTGASDGVVMQSSDGATLNFTGGTLSITSTSGRGFDALNSGTVTVTGGNNTILTTTGRGLDIDNTDIGDADVTFSRIASSGATNGIRLNNTGNSGGDLSVTSNGTGICEDGSTNGCNGGVIGSSTGPGVSLTDVPGAVKLTRVGVLNGTSHGIQANNVAGGIQLNASAVLNSGDAANENGLDYTNVRGVSSIVGTDIARSRAYNVRIANISGTLNLTVNDDDIKTTDASLTGTGEDGLQLVADGTATMRSNITGNRFDDNKGDALQVTSSGAAPNATSDVTFAGNTIDGRAGANTDGGIVVGPDGTVHANVSNNTITGTSVSALIINPNPISTNTASFDAIVNGNTIGTNGVVESGSADGDGIQLKSATDGNARVTMNNNTIQNFAQVGLYLRASESDQSGGTSTQVTATGNTIRQPEATNSTAAIYLVAGTSSTDKTRMCADVGGAAALANTFPGPGPADFIADFVLDLRFAGSTLSLPGYTGTTSANRSSYFLGRNSGFATYAEDTTANTVNPTDAGGGCAQPTGPTLPTAP